MKRILLATSIDAYLHQGGGEQELKNLHKELNKLGFLCDVYGSASLDIDSYDVVIYFSLGNGVNIFLDGIENNDKLLILWPNLWFIDKPNKDYLAFLQTQVNRFDAVVIKSQAELSQLGMYFDIPDNKRIIISSFVDDSIFNYKGSELFKEVYDVDDYILWNGIIEPQKNQLSIIKLLKDYDVNLVISGASRDKKYLDECKSFANGSNDILFIPPMHYMSELHLSAIYNSKVYLELPLDSPGTSSIEAAILNNNLCITDCGWTREHFNGHCTFFDPSDEGLVSCLDTRAPNGVSVLKQEATNYLARNALKNLVNFINRVNRS
ncbi:hypothetical protein B9J90_07130 [Vibrio sp. V09_P4A23P171]|uniref:hypothetical protein n=1 Tax=Vibrio sp. V09_P4A23P171 TaxID=1938664 RepID=UPI000B8E3434|nr:hypothetical protein [Vibrio sp. V09_P4A23P171]OXX36959.1 hypothetical protein B9J90_07130 [Vibrio sp. V09_P4A23P171]